jgi:hypothetical protein
MLKDINFKLNAVKGKTIFKSKEKNGREVKKFKRREKKLSLLLWWPM